MSFYSGVLERVLLPSFNALTGRDYARRRSFLERSQWWSRDQLLAFQFAELKSLVKHALAEIRYYREKYRDLAIGDLKDFSDYRKLPILTREEINAHREELCAPGWAGRLKSHATGGSSGVPTRFYITAESYAWRTAATQRAYSWSGCRLGERTLYLWGSAIGTPSSAQARRLKIFRALRREFMFSTFSQSPQLWQEIYDQARQLKPRFIVAYVSSLEQFCRFLIERNLRLDGIRAVLSAAEPVFDIHRELTEKALGAPLFNCYGSREFMSIAGECDRRQGLHINAENILVETARPPDRGPSEILVTDLHNYGMPFLRYAIGDIGTLDDTPCPCGRGLPRIGSIEGRVLDMLRTRDGRIVPGEFIPHLMKDIPEVAEFRAEQKSLDLIEVSVVLRQPMGDDSRALLDREIHRWFGDATRVEIRPVATIAARPSGKRQVTVGLPLDV